ncbi:BatA domain-containing protein [Marinifilum sp. D737]|uniref:BatA domain-containing protein n=1 Tax=Marinifilum sp. D737 TaxID=2969628 RepID=UPI002274EE8C|nr:BatA domain-containing protein [Marinifilum sp. D737]MCY1636405.1 BatA domain-containing protein [Marinifilum sp. D737]
MSLHFLHPNYLWFLFILLIPIIIHLFNFKRYKKIFFSNLRFLQDLNTENKRKSKLKNLLILLLRILALSCIIIAFSQPYIPISGENLSNKSNELINIYLDNSFSMNGKTEKGKALEVAKNHAFELIKSLPDYAKIRIYSNDIQHYSTSLNKNQAIARIQEIAPSPNSLKLSKTLGNIRLDSPFEKSQVYILSDFQKSQADLEKLQKDSLLNVDFVHFSLQTTNNLVLDSCWFEKPIHFTGPQKELSVKISNHSNKDLKKIPIQLTVNDSLKTVGSIDINKNSSQITKLRYSDRQSGFVQAKLSIEDYPIIYDNNLYFSYSTNNVNRILSINQKSENQYINKLFASDKNFKIKNINKTQLHNETFSEFQLIVLNEIEDIESGFKQSLQTYLQNGGSVLFIPNEQIKASVNLFLSDILAPNYLEIDSTQQRISRLETKTNLYHGVFEDLKDNARLPDIYKSYKLSTPSNPTLESIWLTAGSEKLFTKIQYGKGQLYQFSMNLNGEWTNLITHPILVPTLINLSKTSTNSDKIYYQIGKNNTIELISSFNSNSDEQFHIKNDQIGIDIIPLRINSSNHSTQLRIVDQLRLSENYVLTLKDSILQTCSFNYPRNESEISYYEKLEVEAKIKALDENYFVISSEKMKLSEFYNEKREGRQYWRIFILLALTFFLTEGILKSLKS